MPEPIRLPSLHRHDLLWADPAGWKTMLRVRPDLSALPQVADWAANRWPLVVRRPAATDLPGFLPAALALPPVSGRLRIGVQLDPAIVTDHRGPMAIDRARGAAPALWRPILDALVEVATRHGARLTVFGGLLWQAATGLPYLTESSDADLLWQINATTNPLALAREIASIDATSPVRIDGEILLPDGGGVNWRELARSRHEVFVKTMRGVECRAIDFLCKPQGAAA